MQDWVTLRKSPQPWSLVRCHLAQCRPEMLYSDNAQRVTSHSAVTCLSSSWLQNRVENTLHLQDPSCPMLDRLFGAVALVIYGYMTRFHCTRGHAGHTVLYVHVLCSRRYSRDVLSCSISMLP
ncbi:hypothetical protein FKM82_026795 [Ascaphus truei]